MEMVVVSTVVYLIRHSEPFKIHRGIKKTNESILIENQKSPLSINGERMSELLSHNVEFKNLTEVWSSNYVRAMSTAKYFAHKNKIRVNIDDRLDERIHGVDSWDELPLDFEENQIIDENYKIGYGESQKEVRNRMISVLNELVKNNKEKRIALITHSTAMLFLLKTWCSIKDNGSITFNDNVIFNGKWHYLETFKLEFDSENKLISLTNLNRKNYD